MSDQKRAEEAAEAWRKYQRVRMEAMDGLTLLKVDVTSEAFLAGVRWRDEHAVSADHISARYRQKERIAELEAEFKEARAKCEEHSEELTRRGRMIDNTLKREEMLLKALRDIRWSWANDAGRACDELAEDALAEHAKLKEKNG